MNGYTDNVLMTVFINLFFLLIHIWYLLCVKQDTRFYEGLIFGHSVVCAYIEAVYK